MDEKEIRQAPLARLFPKAVERLGKEIPVWTLGTCVFPRHVYLAVVGARRHSRYGARVCRDIIYGLANMPVVIVSGLAHGIDSIAHRAALEVGLATIAVPGSGIARSVLYPRAHLALAREIVEKGGGILSPFAPRERASRWSFPARNRVMAALADAVLVVEGSQTSGTMITARAAADFGVAVGAVPGEVGCAVSEGPHSLIREGAVLVRGAHDCAEMLGLAWRSARTEPRAQAAAAACALGSWQDVSLPLRDRILALLAQQSGSRDELAVRLGASAADIAREVTMLEIEGSVRDEMGRLTLVAHQGRVR